MRFSSIHGSTRSRMVGGALRCLTAAGLLVVLLGAWFSLAPAPAAAGVASSEPDSSTWVTNGAVYAIYCHKGITYIGGDFTKVGPVGGAMVTRNHIAAIDEDTGRATGWNPNANDIVRAFCNGAGDSVIAAGDFTTIGGANRNFIADLKASDGKATSWNPGTDALVLSVCNRAGWIWAGGMFTRIAGANTNFIGAVWAPGGYNAGQAAWVTNLGCDNWIFSLVAGTVEGFDQTFIGGGFTNLQGKSRNHIARTAGPAIADWNPNANNTVFAQAVSGSNAYAGGSFTSIGGQARNRIAAINISTGKATSWNPNANNQVLAVASAGSTVYAGGSFTNIGGKSRNQIAALDATTGRATSWNPDVNQSVRAIAVSDSYVYVGGFFTTVGGRQRAHFARFALPSAATPAWYLAEGSTAWGFSSYVNIANPNDYDVDARVTYMTDAGPVNGGTIKLPADSQTFIDPSEKLGEKDFSTSVECLDSSKTIAVDRRITWNSGYGYGEGHSSIGVTAPATDWYLPEGSSAWGFECWLLIQNPNSKKVTCTVTYMIEGEGPKAFDKEIPANSRKTFSMAQDIGAKDASIQVHCSSPVIPERAMYKDRRRMGHDSIGTTQANKEYYLAEGTTAWGFTTYVLVQNPNDAQTDVNVTYMTDAGPVAHPENPIKMPANSRKTIRVNDFLPGKDFSTLVEGDSPIIAERAMYWNNGTGEAGHDSIGMPAPHSTFYLPDGWAEPVNDAQTWTLVQNPGAGKVKVRVTYLPAGGAATSPPVSITDEIGANSRKTYNMADSYTGSASVTVECLTTGGKIMVERAMYWYNKCSGTDTIGGYSD